MKIIIIQGSARSKGDTNNIVRVLQKYLKSDFVDLKTKLIHPYDYEHANQSDDFLPLMRHITNYDLVLFATPVYWYTMSGIMKDFFDRITDCLKIEKETGRKLRGMSMAALCCSSDSKQVDGFFNPFEQSADYLGMRYLGNLHTWVEDGSVSEEVEALIRIFAEELNQEKTN